VVSGLDALLPRKRAAMAVKMWTRLQLTLSRHFSTFGRSASHTRIVGSTRGGWFAFLKSVKGVRLRRGGGVNFAGSALVFPGRNGAPFSNEAFNARIKLACQRARVPVWAYTLIVLNALTLLDAADAAVFILLTGRDVSAMCILSLRS
jgi:hypothetical protein